MAWLVLSCAAWEQVNTRRREIREPASVTEDE